MNLSHDSLMSISYTHGDAHIKPLDNDITNLKRQIQANKQIISLHKYQMEVGIDDFRLGDVSIIYIIVIIVYPFKDSRSEHFLKVGEWGKLKE